MGAWGSGSFENDSALDWAASVQSLVEVREPFDRLKALTESKDEAALIDADLASELVAAAETVAMLMGRTIPDFPEALRRRLADAGKPDDLLYHQARGALFHVLRDSELAELWEEAAAESGINEWHEAITGLVDRLNPDLETEPWKPEEIAQRGGGRAGPCIFCDRPIDPDSLFGMTLFDCSDRRAFDRGFWLHLACLNARLHHRHAIVDLKFDPDNLPDPDSL